MRIGTGSLYRRSLVCRSFGICSRDNEHTFSLYTEHQLVTDGRTDGRTDRQNPGYDDHKVAQ